MLLNGFLNLDNLKKNSNKINAVLHSNASLKIVGFIQVIYDNLKLNVPNYGCRITKIILESYLECKENLLEKIVEIDNLKKDIMITDFTVSFLLIDSHFLRRKKGYLVAGCQNLKLKNNGSLSLKRVIIKDKVFLINYDFFDFNFDFFHIIEAL